MDFGREIILTFCQDLRAKGQPQVDSSNWGIGTTKGKREGIKVYPWASQRKEPFFGRIRRKGLDCKTHPRMLGKDNCLMDQVA